MAKSVRSRGEFSLRNNDENKDRHILNRILEDPIAANALKTLEGKGCSLELLSTRLVEPPARNSRVYSAAARKARRKFYERLSADLDTSSNQITGNQDAELALMEVLGWKRLIRFELWLRIAAERYQSLATLRPPTELFTRREYQEFRMLEIVREQTGRWYYKEVAALLNSWYAAHSLPLSKISEDLESHLRKLTHRYRQNTEKRRRAAAQSKPASLFET